MSMAPPVGGDIFVEKIKNMKRKRKSILKWTPTAVVSLVVGLSAVMKIIALPQLVEIYSRIGLVEYMTTLGLAEVLLVAIFIIPRTMRLGLLLLTAWFGGAMAVEFSHGNVFIFPAMILTLVWIAAFLRDRSIFKVLKTQRQAMPA